MWGSFKDRKVTVMGLGLLGQGLAVTRFLVDRGAKVTVTDLKSKKELLPTLKKLKGLPLRYVFGGHKKEDFTGADLIIRNPAVPLDSKYLQIARTQGIPIEMEIGLFFQACPASREKIIGVTGTRGKTTTTLLIGEILKAAGFKVAVGGNITEAAALSLLPKITLQSFVVLELSSWQLEGLESLRLSPHIAVFTNIFPDHLNRYSSMEDYIGAKKPIFKYQSEDDFLVLNFDNKAVFRLGEEAESKVCYFSASELPRKIRRQLKLRGRHNLENVAAAMKVGEILGLDKAVVEKTVISFKGVEHRLEFVREVGGIKFYNDTAATIPEATMAALESFTEPVVLICGGADKNLDFSSLGKAIKSSTVKGVVLLEGSATAKMAAVIDENLVRGRFNVFKKAIKRAEETAGSGDVVLLSPACASFGMFVNEFDRGEQFKEEVRKLNF